MVREHTFALLRLIARLPASFVMDSDMKPRITAARSLADEIARIGQLDRRRSSGRMQGEVNDGHGDSLNQMEISHGGALPVSPPNDLSGRLLKVVVSDSTAKTDLCELWKHKAVPACIDLLQQADWMNSNKRFSIFVTDN